MSITYELLESGVAVLTFDDGKANALSPSSLTTLSNLLDRCAEEANSVVLVGREGVLSAGFDLKIMTSGGEAAAGLVTQGCNVLLKLYEHPQPVVIASPGHAVAGGAVLMLCGDHRVSAEGDYKIGLNEVRIGLPMPIFVSELVRERVTRSSFVAATLFATIYSPEEALSIGLVDELCAVDQVRERAIERATELAKLPAGAYASTKRSIRGTLITHVRATLEDDMVRVIADGDF